ncbi:hypothetical protein B0T10DRAFT_457537 [Thelonectria olida]|uniref:DUF4470 domain-containing protein n=1 Tax=Thelonectria olida TaxID=1576542 RepID=A0A9P8W826_9HYPO|nr:hypothetical protein B0T10DRAFT_457537 [Thelonectria olida]
MADAGPSTAPVEMKNTYEYNGNFPITKPICPARRGANRCLREATVACSRCLIIAYCSLECMIGEMEDHPCLEAYSVEALKTKTNEKTSCHEAFWGEHAATDVLNLPENEGRMFEGHLRLLFLGVSSLRHLVYTVTKIPDTARPQLSATLSETDSLHFTRLILIVLLLADETVHPIINAEAAIHLWYSYRMTIKVRDHIEKVAITPLRTLASDVMARFQDGTFQALTLHPLELPCGKFKVFVELNRAKWKLLLDKLPNDHPSPPRYDLAITARVAAALDHPVPNDHPYHRMTPSRQVGVVQWRVNGVLAPYGHPMDDFRMFNPIFLCDPPRGSLDEPLAEWPMELFDYPCGPAQDDVYGKMFYYVRDLFIAFQRRARDLAMTIRIISRGLEELPDWAVATERTQHFDRIEATSAFETFSSFTTIAMLSGLLRHKDENPAATLLACSREMVNTPVVRLLPELKEDLRAEQRLLWTRSGTALDEYAPPLVGTDLSSVEAVRRRLGLIMWRDWDRFSECFLNYPTPFDRLVDHVGTEVDPPAERGLRAAANMLNIVLKDPNTITNRWPNRFVHSHNDRPGRVRFDRWLSWVDTRPERWLEWQRVGSLRMQEWQIFADVGWKHLILGKRWSMERVVGEFWESWDYYLLDGRAAEAEDQEIDKKEVKGADEEKKKKKQKAKMKMKKNAKKK